MAVRIRMKKMGRRHRPFFRICAMDGRSPRDGRVIEELGHYDPMVRNVDARAVLKADRIDYWLSVGAQPSDKVGVLIKKYGSNGTHVEAQKTALEALANAKPTAPPPIKVPLPEPEKPAEEAAAEEGASAEAPAEEAPAAEAASTEASDGATEGGGDAAATEETPSDS